MKSRRIYDAVATVGEYTDRQTGEKKKVRKNVGTVFEAQDGRLSLKLELVPVGPGWSGFISFYPIEDQQQRGTQQSAGGNRPTHQNGAPPPQQVPANQEDDDIPF